MGQQADLPTQGVMHAIRALPHVGWVYRQKNFPWRDGAPVRATVVLTGTPEPIATTVLTPHTRSRTPSSACASGRYTLFEVLEGEAHQPFQEVPDRWDARVTSFWQSINSP